MLAEVLSLLAVTLTEIAVLIVGSLSSSPNFRKYGFMEATGEVLHKYHTQTSNLCFCYLGRYIHLGLPMDYLCMVVCFTT